MQFHGILLLIELEINFYYNFF